MSVETTYPLTIGQLSIFRDAEKLPADRLWEANLPFAWDLRQECSVEDVWTALGALAMRHESLRTNYVLGADGLPRQYLVADDAEAVLARLDRDIASIADYAAVEEDKYQQAIDVYAELPWRVCVFTDADGVPKRLLVIAHHITADGAASLILQDDLHALLSGAELPPPAGQPRTMALNQQGAGAPRLRAAERYWRRTLEAAPRRPALIPPGGAMIGATLHTGIPLELGHEGADKMDASLASAVLAAYYDALRAATGASEILLIPMSANRFDAGVASVVTSLNQWVPLLLEFDGGESIGELSRVVHWKAFNAFKNGTCDPDAIVRIRDEFFEQADPPVSPGYNFNAILAPPGFASGVRRVPSETEFYVPARATGPGFYLIARGIETIDLIVRVNRPEFDQPKVAAFLASMQESLLTVAGLDA